MKCARCFCALLRTGTTIEEAHKVLPQFETPYSHDRCKALAPADAVNPARPFPPRSSMPDEWSIGLADGTHD